LQAEADREAEAFAREHPDLHALGYRLARDNTAYGVQRAGGPNSAFCDRVDQAVEHLRERLAQEQAASEADLTTQVARLQQQIADMQRQIAAK
jgi:uncharacterized protein YceH (UPF0502 family)